MASEGLAKLEKVVKTEKFDEARHTFLNASEELAEKLAFRSDELVLSSWGSDGETLINNIGALASSGRKPNISNDEFKRMARGWTTIHWNISSAIISRLVLIKHSCLRTSSKWTGLSNEINEMRGIIERYATLADLHSKIGNVSKKYEVKDHENWFELSDICLKSTGTRFDWRANLGKPFSDMADVEYKFDSSLDLQNFQSKSILGAIDRVQKRRMPGLRPCYSFCCEFVHPNIGDAIAVATDLEINSQSDQSILRQRKINALHKPNDEQLSLAPDIFLVIEAYHFMAKLLADLTEISDDLRRVVFQSRRQLRIFVHNTLRKNIGDLFHQHELCPCGSGLTVRACRRQN